MAETLPQSPSHLHFEDHGDHIEWRVTALDPATSPEVLEELERQAAAGSLTISLSAPASSSLGQAIKRMREL